MRDRGKVREQVVHILFLKPINRCILTISFKIYDLYACCLLLVIFDIDSLHRRLSITNRKQLCMCDDLTQSLQVNQLLFL